MFLGDKTIHQFYHWDGNLQLAKGDWDGLPTGLYMIINSCKHTSEDAYIPFFALSTERP